MFWCVDTDSFQPSKSQSRKRTLEQQESVSDEDGARRDKNFWLNNGLDLTGAWEMHSKGEILCFGVLVQETYPATAGECIR